MTIKKADVLSHNCIEQCALQTRSHILTQSWDQRDMRKRQESYSHYGSMQCQAAWRSGRNKSLPCERNSAKSFTAGFFNSSRVSESAFCMLLAITLMSFPVTAGVWRFTIAAPIAVIATSIKRRRSGLTSFQISTHNDGDFFLFSTSSTAATSPHTCLAETAIGRNFGSLKAPASQNTFEW